MSSYIIDALATEEAFEEVGYLSANPDVVNAIRNGDVASAIQHFRAFGKRERRMQRCASLIAEPKRRKLERIRPILREDMRMLQSAHCFDFMTPELHAQFHIIDTDAVSSNGYDRHAVALINKYSDGLILDCGAGRRGTYYDNVVNFEIVAYDTTDVRGVGERLPFKDSSFDALFSLSVLEHVKDPFQCAREITRVLKPGGELMCAVPFLQPMHGYPHHYYNMSARGLRNLFEAELAIDRHEVYGAVLPIYSLTWIIGSWIQGLEGRAREEFLNMKVADFSRDPATFLNRPFVRNLSDEKNFELASATVIFGRKPKDSQASKS
jgi:SAM-dependent methyltransferase